MSSRTRLIFVPFRPRSPEATTSLNDVAQRPPTLYDLAQRSRSPASIGVQHDALPAAQQFRKDIVGSICCCSFRKKVHKNLSGHQRAYIGSMPGRLIDGLKKVQHELLSVYATQLLEKEHSGCRALLRDDMRVEKRDIVGTQEQVFVRKVIELHDKYMAYVNDCFMNHTLFHKGVAGSSSAELLATFCDNILKKGGSEKLSDEAIEETFEKVNLVGY
ncbi:hypothetical protein V2J09_016505 [Rumex salicifolius]